MITRRYPRSTADAFRHTDDYRCAITHYGRPRNTRSFSLKIIGFLLLAVAVYCTVRA